MMKKVPKRRFKGFLNAGDWEQRKLGECIDSFEYGLNAAAMEYDGKHKYIRITDIDDETHAFIQDNLTSPAVDFNGSTSNYRLKMGDIVFARTGASVGKTYLYNPNDGDLYYAGFLIRGKVKEECDAGFIYQNTLTKEYDSFIRITSQRSGQPGVNSKEYATFRLNIPCKDEQEKISKVLNSLDELFTLHQRKLEKLQATKKALLYELFPIENSRKPKRRFKGFTGDWEQRKLGEIADIIGGGTPSTSFADYWDGNIDWYSPVEICSNRYVSDSIRKITKLGLEKSSTKILPVGTVLFTSRAGIGNTAILRKEGCTNQGFQSIIPRKNLLDTYFLYTLTPRLKRYGELMGAGSTFVEVSGRQMEKMPLNIPSLEEQKKVGKLFEILDDSITLHQRKLEKLKNLKAAYLNEMFV